eukprot:GHUV01017930.1.p1 GENE.GHUV01017930.1~~GHUV01017930.1.p1  ORF type:complete len:140 (-),score=41.48 GHUV01017930.1:350-769(-)
MTRTAAATRSPISARCCCLNCSSSSPDFVTNTGLSKGSSSSTAHTAGGLLVVALPLLATAVTNPPLVVPCCCCYSAPDPIQPPAKLHTLWFQPLIVTCYSAVRVRDLQTAVCDFLLWVALQVVWHLVTAAHHCPPAPCG